MLSVITTPLLLLTLSPLHTGGMSVTTYQLQGGSQFTTLAVQQAVTVPLQSPDMPLQVTESGQSLQPAISNLSDGVTLQ